VTVIWSDSADFSITLTKGATPTLYDQIIITMPQNTVASDVQGSLVCAVAFSARPGAVYPLTTISAPDIGKFSISAYPNPILAPGAIPLLQGGSDAPNGFGGWGAAGPIKPIPGFFYDWSFGLEFHITGCFNDATERLDGCIVALLDDDGKQLISDTTSVQGATNFPANNSRFLLSGFRSGTVDTNVPSDFPPLTAPEKMFGVAGMASIDGTPAIVDFTPAANWVNLLTRTRNTPGPCFTGSAVHAITSTGQTSDIIPIGSMPAGASQIRASEIVQLGGIFSTAPIAEALMFAVDSGGANIGTILDITTPVGGGANGGSAIVDVPVGTAGIRVTYQWTGGSGIISVTSSFLYEVEVFCSQNSPYTYAATIAQYTATLPDPAPAPSPVAYSITNPTPVTLPTAPGFGSGDWAIVQVWNYDQSVIGRSFAMFIGA